MCTAQMCCFFLQKAMHRMETINIRFNVNCSCAKQCSKKETRSFTEVVFLLFNINQQVFSRYVFVRIEMEKWQTKRKLYSHNIQIKFNYVYTQANLTQKCNHHQQIISVRLHKQTQNYKTVCFGVRTSPTLVPPLPRQGHVCRVRRRPWGSALCHLDLAQTWTAPPCPSLQGRFQDFIKGGPWGYFLPLFLKRIFVHIK